MLNIRQPLDSFSILFLKGIVLHILALLSVYHLLFFVGAVSEFPWNNTGTFIQWDAIWYETLKDRGYYFSYDEQSNIAFFPLFPFVWSLLGLKNGEMCILNFVVYLGGIYFLAKQFKQEIRDILLMISLPSAFFFYQLYTESFFFLSCTILLMGYVKKDWRLQLAGFLLASVTRSAGTMFPPAILTVELFLWVLGRQNWRSMLWNTTWKLVVCIGTFKGVLFYQEMVTGAPGGYFYAMAKFWDRSFHLPQFPFWSWERSNNFWMDGLGFTVALFAGMSLLQRCFIFLKKQGKAQEWGVEESALVFSEAYLVAILGIALFFSPSGDHGTFLMSINRYVLATPFTAVFLWLQWKRLTYSKLQITLTISVLVLVFYLFQTFSMEYYSRVGIFYHVLCACYFLFFYFYQKYKTDLFLTFYLINLCLQVVALIFFLNGKWIG